MHEVHHSTSIHSLALGHQNALKPEAAAWQRYSEPLSAESNTTGVCAGHWRRYLGPCTGSPGEPFPKGSAWGQRDVLTSEQTHGWEARGLSPPPLENLIPSNYWSVTNIMLLFF